MGTNNITRMISVLASMVLVNGCAKSPTSGSIPEAGLTMSEIYRASMANARPETVPRYSQTKTVSHRVYHGDYRKAETVGRKEFKALENPTIPIHIYPHVALIGDEQLIKPGITTEFFLYKQNQYALASERY